MHKAHEESHQAFSFIYEHNLWGCGSGMGSLPETTLEYRNFLEKFLAQNAIGTVVDFGCGDWAFSRYIYWWKATYTGYDTVKSLIEKNNQQFSTEDIHFHLSPENFSDITSADLLLIKDVLQHWDIDTIKGFLASIKGKFNSILITNSLLPEEAINKEIRVGQYRPVDLLTPPFSLKAETVLCYSVNITDEKGQPHFDKKQTILLRDW